MLLASQPSLFDIELTSPNPIILHGTASEATSQILSGKIVLELSEPTSVKQIHLKLTGRARLMWTEGVGATTRSHVEESEIYKHSWEFLHFRNSSHTLNAGRHEFDFSLEMPGDLPESIYCADGYIYYKLKAVMERPTFAANSIARKHVRLVRALAPTALEFTQTVSIENEWADKLDYDISIPQKAYFLGDSIPISIKLTPQIKNLQVDHITCSLKEYSNVIFGNESRLADARTEKSRTRIIRTIKMQDFVRNDQPLVDMATLASVEDIRRQLARLQQEGFATEEDLQQDLSSTSSAAILGDASEEQPALWNFQGRLVVPPNKHLCNPSFNSYRTPQFIIRHKLKISIFLLNSDGHLSELRAALPIIVLSERSHNSDGTPDNEQDDLLRALPSYHDHIYDHLTSVASGQGDYLVTPPLSRDNSYGQLSDLAQLSEINPNNSASTSPLQGQPQPPSAADVEQGIRRGRGRAVGALSRSSSRGSEPTPLATPSEELEDAMLVEAMSRVPSYSDATNVTTSTFIPPFSASLPCYEAAVAK